MAPPPEPELEVAVPLLGAYACRLAEDASIRALLIKGAPATAAGVRADRASVDVDLWVDPRRFDHYLLQLESRGWRRHTTPTDALGSGHAVTMVHDWWVCSIDVHRRFPGLLERDDVVFDEVWRARSSALVGRQQVAVPSRVSAAAITVLHTIRSAGKKLTADDLECALATAASFSAAERGELAALALATGSAEPLAELLVAAGCRVPEPAAAAERLAEWRLQAGVRRQPGAAWILALRRSSWPERLRLLGTAARPTNQDYAAVGGDRSRRGTVRAMRKRWHRGLGALPGAWQAVGRAPAVPQLLNGSRPPCQ